MGGDSTALVDPPQTSTVCPVGVGFAEGSCRPSQADSNSAQDAVDTASGRVAACSKESVSGKGAASRVAAFAAHCAVAVFGVAYDDWANTPETNFTALITATADELQKAVAATPPG